MKIRTIKNASSTFLKDVELEKTLSKILYEILFVNYLDKHRKTKSKFITFEEDADMQFKGVDIIVPLRKNPMYIDMKCQTNKYINNPAPTYCVELSYLKNGEYRVGWFLDKNKITTHYLFVWLHDVSLGKGGGISRKSQIKKAEFMIVSKRDIMDFFYRKRLGKKKLDEIQQSMRKNQEQSLVVNEVKFVCSLQLNEKPVNAIIHKAIYEKMPHTQHYMYEDGKITEIKKSKKRY